MKTVLASLVALSIPFFAALSPAVTSTNRPSLFGPRHEQIAASKNAKTYVVWVYFTDKGPPSRLKAMADTQVVSRRALARRRKIHPTGPLLDFTDYPVYQPYVDEVARLVERIRYRSKWFNAVSVVATRDQLYDIEALSFVNRTDLLERYKNVGKQSISESQGLFPSATNDSLPYGYSRTQITQLNIQAEHDRGNHGEGVLIGLFDTGIENPHHRALDSAFAHLIAAHDFVRNAPKPWPLPGEKPFGGHGMMTLSTIGGFVPDTLIGPAYGASYVLARTEDAASETPLEEDDFVAAIEWADSIGIDIASISLSYLDFDDPFRDNTWKDMNGNTMLMTRAADMAASKGILVVVSAGNSYSAAHNTLGSPADGDSVLTVGAVGPNGKRADFSSVGPTTGPYPRIKPDVMAMGESVVVASGSGFKYADGTSFSCPLTAGAAALILHAVPWATPMDIIEALKATASNAKNPNNLIGWGIPNVEKAIEYLKNKKP